MADGRCESCKGDLLFDKATRRFIHAELDDASAGHAARPYYCAGRVAGPLGTSERCGHIPRRDSKNEAYCGNHDPNRIQARKDAAAAKKAAAAERARQARAPSPGPAPDTDSTTRIHHHILNAAWHERPAILATYRATALQAAKDLRDALASADAGWAALLPVEEAIRILEREDRAENRAYNEAAARAGEAHAAAQAGTGNAEGSRIEARDDMTNPTGA